MPSVVVIITPSTEARDDAGINRSFDETLRDRVPARLHDRACAATRFAANELGACEPDVGSMQIID